MAQKWYEKATVQGALVGGICVILAAFVAGVFDLYEIKQPAPSDRGQHEPNDGSSEIRHDSHSPESEDSNKTSQSNLPPIDSLPKPGERVSLSPPLNSLGL